MINHEKKSRLFVLQNNLNRTDYKEFKNLRGDYTAKEWQAIDGERQAWREEIRALKAELSAKE